MSIGDFGGNSNSNNNSNKVYEGTYYSRLRLKQSDSSKTIGVSFRSGLLIISINLAENGSFKYEPTETIYLSPTKAKLLANQIAIFKDYYLTGKIDEGKAFEPDFLMFANDKKTGNTSWQIFIEPKGSQFADANNKFENSKEGWKQQFLAEITNRDEARELVDNDRYRIIGLPFYNKELTKTEFKDTLQKLK